MDSESYSIKNYAVLASYLSTEEEEKEVIHIKIADATTYSIYEQHIDSNELRKDLYVKDQYKIITKCFAAVAAAAVVEAMPSTATSTSRTIGVGGEDKEDGEEDRFTSNYHVKIMTTSDGLKLVFNATVGGFLRIENLTLNVKEKILSSDSRLNLHLNRMDQTHVLLASQLSDQKIMFEAEIDRLMKIIANLEVAIVPPAHWSCKSQNHTSSNIAAKLLTLNDGATGGIIFRNVKAFFQLDRLVINDFRSLADLSAFKNESVTEMELNCNGHAGLTSIDGLSNFPRLKQLIVNNASGLISIVPALKSQSDRIKTLVISACPKVNVYELTTYCQVHGIALVIS